MTAEAYRLSLILREAVSDDGTTEQTIAIAAATESEAIEVARTQSTRLTGKAWCSATLTDSSGNVIWWKREWKRADGS